MAKKSKAPSPAKRKRRRAFFKQTFEYSGGRHPLQVYLDGLGRESQRTMRGALESVVDILSNGRVTADDLAWHELRSNHVASLRRRMQELYTPSTANRYLAALRGVLKEAWRLDHMDRETMERTVDVAPIRGSRQPSGRSVNRDELMAIFTACAASENAPAGARDAAILALLYGTGLRRSEAASTTLKDFDSKAGSLRIVGKGNKERVVYLPKGTCSALEAWLSHRGEGPGPLFLQVVKGGRVRDHGITDQLIYHIVRKRHLEAGVAPFTPHDLRRSFISELLDEGVDLSTVARQVGHSNVQTTAKYDRRDARAQKLGVDRLDVPFSPG